MISFEPLFEYMKARNISAYRLVKDRIIGRATLDNMRTGKKSITTDTIDAICNYLGCEPSDIMRYSPSQEDRGQD